jgi:hypothetical protein
LPASGGVEEIEIEGDGKNGDLEEIEKAKRVDAGGVLVGARKKDHEDRSGPDEIKDIGWPGDLGGTGDETLVVGANGLGDRFKSEGESEEIPDLSGIAGRTARSVKGAAGGEEAHGEVQGVGDEEIGEGGANKFEVEDKKKGKKESGGENETRKLAGREQDDLTVAE